MGDLLTFPRVGATGLQEKTGNYLLVLAAVFLVAGVPAMYGMGAIGLTTVNLLGRFLALVIASIGLDLVWGYTGILSLCQAMFFCFGGYAIGMHMALHGPMDPETHTIPMCLFVVSSQVGGMKLPWFWELFRSLPVAMMLGLFLPGLFGFIFGFFTFRSRVKGVYFSIITQATTLAISMVFCINNMKLCGTNGLTNFVTLGGFDLQEPRVKLGLYMLTAGVLVGVYLVCQWIVKSRLGRLLVAVRDNENRLRFAGYQPVTFKVFIFVVGAIAAGLAGMLYTPQNGIITPFKMEAKESILIVAFVAVGGRGTLSGAVIGTLVVSYLQSFLTSGTFYGLLPAFLKMQDGVQATGVMGMVRRSLKLILGADGWDLVLGLVFIVVTLILPGGIVGAWRSLMSKLAGPRNAGLAGVEKIVAKEAVEVGA